MVQPLRGFDQKEVIGQLQLFTTGQGLFIADGNDLAVDLHFTVSLLAGCRFL